MEFLGLGLLALGLLAIAVGAIARRRRLSRLPAVVDMPALQAEMATLIRRGDRTGAVSLHRSRTGSSLYQAVQAVNDLAAPDQR